MKIFYWILIGLLVLGNDLNAQSTFNGYGASIHTGFLTGDDFTLVMGVEGTYLLGKRIFTAGFRTAEEIKFLSDCLTDRLHEINLMTGAYKDINVFRFHYLVGLSYNWGHLKGKRTPKSIYNGGFGFSIGGCTDDFEKDTFATFGIPFQTGVKIMASKSFSIGLDLHANFNLERSYLMPTVSLAFGKFKK